MRPSQVCVLNFCRGVHHERRDNCIDFEINLRVSTCADSVVLSLIRDSRAIARLHSPAHTFIQASGAQYLVPVHAARPNSKSARQISVRLGLPAIAESQRLRRGLDFDNAAVVRTPWGTVLSSGGLRRSPLAPSPRDSRSDERGRNKNRRQHPGRDPQCRTHPCT